MAVDIWKVLETAGALGFMACLVPQFVRTVKRRSADDLSVPFLLLVLFASAVTLPTMVHSNLPVLAVSQGMNIAVWGTVLYFRIWPGKGDGGEGDKKEGKAKGRGKKANKS